MMGYGGTPSWRIREENSYREMLHHDRESSQWSEINQLKKENEELRAKIKQLEDENKDLRAYIDCLKS
jgi:cell division protein FtsB